MKAARWEGFASGTADIEATAARWLVLLPPGIYPAGCKAGTNHPPRLLSVPRSQDPEGQDVDSGRASVRCGLWWDDRDDAGGRPAPVGPGCRREECVPTVDQRAELGARGAETVEDLARRTRDGPPRDRLDREQLGRVAVEGADVDPPAEVRAARAAANPGQAQGSGLPDGPRPLPSVPGGGASGSMTNG